MHSGLPTGRHAVGADVAVVTQGPGNLGTGTRWGYSGVAAGEAVNAAAALVGLPVVSLRVSFADPRERHRGVSHHSLTAYGRVALARSRVAISALPEPQGTRVAAEAAPLASRQDLVTVPVDGLAEPLRASPVPPSRWAVRWTRTSPTSWRLVAACKHARVPPGWNAEADPPDEQAITALEY